MAMNGSPIDVLLIEDSPGDARLIRELLVETPGARFTLQHADSLAAGIEHLAAQSPSVVLLDLGLPDARGFEGLAALQARAPGTPVVVLTGLDDEDTAVRAVEEGAQDYLIKGGIESGQLVRAIRYSIGRQQVDEALRLTVQELEQRNQELESFTYSVSHDLKEPLRTIEAFSQFLLEDYASHLDDQGRDYLQRMSKASGRLKQMIEELLTPSRLGRPPEELTRVDVGQVVADIAAAMQVALDQRRARIVIDDTLPLVRGDLARIEQILGNLISNGLKFNRDQTPVVHVGLETIADGSATFYVRDNGIGIDPQYQEQIFGIFQRLHRREEYDGTGAGLAIVKRAAEAIGGQVCVRSEPGAGSTFLVSLPVWTERPAAKALEKGEITG